MTWQSWTTLAIAILGAVLGLYNSWNGYQDRKVRLRVVPKWSIAQDWSGMGIEVVNFSTFAVTIVEVGFTIGRGRGALPRRIPIPNGNIVHATALPAKLERRDVYSTIFNLDGLAKHDIRRAYAITASGELATGTSGALKQFIKTRRPL